MARLDWIVKAKTMEQQVFRYQKLHGLLDDYKSRLVLDFDQNSAQRFQELKKQKIRIGTMDLKIAAIGSEKQRVVCQRDGSNFQIHRTDAEVADRFVAEYGIRSILDFR